MSEVVARVKSKTPDWFKRIRNAGLLLTGVGTALLTSPVTLPALVISIAGYLVVGGTVAAAIAQTAKESE